jgi:transcriptional regulator
MAYPPPYYTDPDPDFVRRIMVENAFALLIVGELHATHLPLLVTEDGYLEGHISRQNPIAEHIGGSALAVFSGPHGYVSANLYDNPGAQVPTWNYTSVQVRGRLVALPDTEILPHLSRVAEMFEDGEGAWSPADAPVYVSRLVSGIVAFRLEVESLKAFRKMSGNKPPAIRKRIIDAARASGEDAFANEMRLALQDNDKKGNP